MYVGHLLTLRAEGLDLGRLGRWRQLATINLRPCWAEPIGVWRVAGSCMNMWTLVLW